MKQADITLTLYKGHEVIKKNVTPIEAMLLVAEHHSNAGECPVKVIDGTEREIETGQFDEIEVTSADGKMKSKQKVAKSRSVDEELDRLRGKYAGAKVKALDSVRDLNIDFKKALEQGIKLVIPTQKLSEHKLI